MFIYSGKCRFCEIGLDTDLEDDCGYKLKTGDIVLIYRASETLGITSINGMSVVVANHYSNVVGESPKELPEIEKSEPFIMGIQSVKLNAYDTYINGAWRVTRIKSCFDVVEGEH